MQQLHNSLHFESRSFLAVKKHSALKNQYAWFHHVTYARLAILVKHNPERQTLEEVLLDSYSTPDAVALAGEEILLALYGATSTTLSLNPHRRHLFMKEVATCLIQLGALPPTSAAAREHYWHVYHQVQS